MNLIEEILEVEKHSNELIQKARENASLTEEKVRENYKKELRFFSSEMEKKEIDEEQKQEEELVKERKERLEDLEKELQGLKQKASAKKKEAVIFSVTEILNY